MSWEAKLERPEHQLQKLHVHTSDRKQGDSAMEIKADEQIQYWC